MDGDAALAGRLLVATPSLRDPNFAHTVVLMLDHGDEGALGLVLNRPSAVEVATVLPARAAAAAAPAVVFAGGPVQPDAIIGLVGMDPAVERPQILPGLAALDLAREPTEHDSGPVRLFAGYAGWGPGQLEDEIASGSWFEIPGAADDALTDDPEGLWRRVLVRQGGVFRTVPENPTAN